MDAWNICIFSSPRRYQNIFGRCNSDCCTVRIGLCAASVNVGNIVRIFLGGGKLSKYLQIFVSQNILGCCSDCCTVRIGCWYLLMHGILSEYFWRGIFSEYLSLKITLDAAVIVVWCGLVGAAHARKRGILSEEGRNTSSSGNSSSNNNK